LFINHQILTYFFSRVKLTSEGKIIVKGLKGFDLKERCNVLEIVLAEKITSAKPTERHLKMLTEEVESIKGEMQEAQTQAKGLVSTVEKLELNLKEKEDKIIHLEEALTDCETARRTSEEKIRVYLR
jgi:chromosome segregation ATPase